jgi:allophanate hydrolase subunit 1
LTLALAENHKTNSLTNIASLDELKSPESPIEEMNRFQVIDCSAEMNTLVADYEKFNIDVDDDDNQVKNLLSLQQRLENAISNYKLLSCST